METASGNTVETGSHQLLKLGALIAFLLSPYLVLSLLGSESYLIGFFPDDAFYYIKTALNVLEVGFASFDGVNPTNGFHPLYFLLVTALVGLVPTGWFLNAVFLLHIILMWLSLFLLLVQVKNLTVIARAFIAAIFSFPAPFLFVWVSAGMEAPLVVLSTVLLLNAWLAATHFDFKNYRANFWLGGAMTVFILSRLDLILALIPFVALLLIHQIRLDRVSVRSSMMSILTVLALPFLCGITYITFNIVTTGHVLPVSAAIKQAFFVPFSVSWNASTGNGNILQASLALAPFVISMLTLFLSMRNQNKSQVFKDGYAVVLAAISVIIYYLYLFTYASNFFRWYFAMPLAASAWIVVHWLSKRESKINIKRRTLIFASVALVLVVFASNVLFVRYVATLSKSTSWHLMQIAQKLDQVTLKCDVVAVYDAGAIGYFSSSRVINLDGLANSYTYMNEYLRTGKMLEYLENQGVSVYLLRDHHATNRVELASGQYEFVQFAPDTRVVLRRQDEIFRYVIPGAFTVIAYRYKTARKPDCFTARS